MDNSALQQYMSLYNQYNSGGGQGLAMTGGGSTKGLSNFFNTPAYQLQYGSGAANQLAATGSYNPSLAFEQDPGVQIALSQSNNAVTNNMAAKGLGGQSGALANGLMNNIYSNYNNYTGQQANLFSNYQNQLNGLSQFGSTQNGAQNTFNAGNTLGALLSGNYTGAGNSLASANLSTGSNISGLLANQGVLNANAYMNTGAAQANNIFQGNEFAAQIVANQLASNAGTQNGFMSSQGYQNANNQSRLY